MVTKKTIASSPVQRSQSSKHKSFQNCRLQILSKFASPERQEPPTSERRGRSLMRVGFPRGPVCPLQKAGWTRSRSPTLMVWKGPVKPTAESEGRIFK